MSGRICCVGYGMWSSGRGVMMSAEVCNCIERWMMYQCRLVSLCRCLDGLYLAVPTHSQPNITQHTTGHTHSLTSDPASSHTYGYIGRQQIHRDIPHSAKPQHSHTRRHNPTSTQHTTDSAEQTTDELTPSLPTAAVHINGKKYRDN